MDLKLFFDPIGLEPDKSSNNFESSIYSNHHKMPDHFGMDVALIGLRSQTDDNSVSANEIRKQLYKLKKGSGEYAIIDLGNLRNGPSEEDTVLRIKEVCSYLMEKEIIPIMFGADHGFDLGQFLGYEPLEKMVSLLTIDNRVDLSEGEGLSNTHSQKIFNHSPNFLFNYHHLAYQSYLVDQKSITLLDKLGFESTRLGVLKEDVKSIEPVIRDADLLSFDLSAVQASYAPEISESTVYGLSGEEACQICWYAGQSEKMSSVGIYNDSQIGPKSAFVVGTMIWYFIEGYYHRKGEKSFKSNDYLMYEVHLGVEPDTIRFYKSKKSERWWMEVPNEIDQGLFNRSRMIACNYSDYEEAMRGDVPERWINFSSKTSI